MRRNLFIVCEEKNRERFLGRVINALGDSVRIVTDAGQADLAYVIGNISPGMKEEIGRCQMEGIKTVKVNENLINEELFEKMPVFRITKERGGDGR